MTEHATPRVTVAVATRNRPDSLVRCLTSLAALGETAAEIIVADDASDEPVGPVLDRVPAGVRSKVRLIEQPSSLGYLVGRNRMVREAAHPYVLSMDDDAYILEAEGIRHAVRLFDRDPALGAMAFSQAGADGTPWPSSMQPAPVSYPCHIPAYIGFAHLLRRDVFRDVGGYDESFFFYGEEKDWCLRALDAGSHVVYLPDVLVAHVPDLSGRDPRRYLRYVVRNDCLSALRREPWPLPIVSVPIRLRRYLAMRRHSGVSDPGGFAWLVRSLLSALPSTPLGGRVRWTTLRRWRQIHRDRPRYQEPVL
jgi:GT2 family glycosyltransferase